ncbi:DUF4365 domain-containing protein [Streptomyces sp. HYC2]|uniref:DUF4365 domain-containing protein n=1 Tax=Streptomyces sp. HYC2 TaxID=2955207 RepID=UPI00248131B0|nr:DUF4365 domain-containing protein [Streptomyces sp. HYC2]
MNQGIGPKIQRQHLTGGIGELLVRKTFLEAGVPVIDVDQGDDYGTDLIAQVPHTGTNQLSGRLVRIQVKCGGPRYHRADGTGRCHLSAEHRAYYTDGPIPSILVTVNSSSEKMHWGNITEQLRRDPRLAAVSAPHAFHKGTVAQILRIAKQAGPGDWALSLSSNDPIARRIAVEGCLLTASEDRRVIDALRAYATRMTLHDLSFIGARLTEEMLKNVGQETLFDFTHKWEDDLEESLPASRSSWDRPPYPDELLQYITETFKFSENDIMEIIERNQEIFELLPYSDWSSSLHSASRLLDMHPEDHARSLISIFIRSMDHSYAIPAFIKALELDPSVVQHHCEQAGIRVMDIIIETFEHDPVTASVMWALWSEP